ncbi:MAG: hypothetical protein GY711_21840 [bacterium]|nr:hypothetical protein [bacterium]
MKPPKTALCTFSLLAAALGSSPLATASQEPAGTAEASAPAVDDGKSVFGDPVYVNGKRISDFAIKRYLCYGKGRNALESRKLQALMDQEITLRQRDYFNRNLEDTFPGKLADELTDDERKQVQAKVDEEMKRFEIDETYYEYELKRQNDDFIRRYPTLDLDTEILRAYQSVDWYEDQLHQTLQFDQIFYPGDANDWPELTIEAIHGGSPNVDLVEDYRKNWLLRKEEAERENKPLRREDEMMMTLLRDFVMNALNAVVEVDTSYDGIPENLLMAVEGQGIRREITVDEVYEDMKHAFTENDIREAKEFLALLGATKDKLTEMNQLQDAETFHQYWEGLHADLKDTMFNMDFLALSGHQFPSRESYYRHMGLLESFRKMIAPDLEKNENGTLSEALQSHLPVANGIMGLAKADVDILLVSAFDFPNYKWKENGWEWAEKEAIRIREEVDAYLDKLGKDADARAAAEAAGTPYTGNADLKSFAEFWSNMLDIHSEYWDPPLPAEGKTPPAIGLKNKGRFGLMTRNDLKRAIGESSYWHYLSGSSIVDTIFFDLEPGTIGGPYYGPHGFYIVYLETRTAPTNPLNYRTDRHFEMLKEDYTRARFTEFSHQALKDAKVQGLN